MVTKKVRPSIHDVNCDVCGRTILKGERTEPYLVLGGQRRLVCELCVARAEAEGWIRESAHGDLPTAGRRPEPRRSLLSRMLGRAQNGATARPEAAPAPVVPGEAVEHVDEPDLAANERPAPPQAPIARRTDARHVRAVPTNAQVKVERAVDLFNASAHARTIAGIARTLGEPWVSAHPAPGAPSEVVIVVAWELSWYRYRVDLGDADDPVGLLGKGEELDEIESEDRDWNVAADADGHLVTTVRSGR